MTTDTQVAHFALIDAVKRAVETRSAVRVARLAAYEAKCVHQTALYALQDAEKAAEVAQHELHVAIAEAADDWIPDDATD